MTFDGRFLQDLFGKDFMNIFELPEAVAYSSEPDPERYVSILDLFKDHKRRMEEAQQDDESAMMTPRITVREHADMHLLMMCMDSHMTELDRDWYKVATAYAVGNNSETLENLTLRSREITEAAKLRYALNRAHVEWAKKVTVTEESGDAMLSRYPDMQD